jgi:hypothetical protein
VVATSALAIEMQE